MKWMQWLFPELRLFDNKDARERAICATSPSWRWIFLPLALVVILWFALSGFPILGDDILRNVCGLSFLFLLSTPWIVGRNNIRRKLRAILVEDGIEICVPCGYDLTGNENGICPECGHDSAIPA